MHGEKQVIDNLQAQLKNSLSSINQYFLHYRMLKHWGFNDLAGKESAKSICEMKRSDKLIERIFMLDGLPNLQHIDKLLIGEDVIEILKCDLKTEIKTQNLIKSGISCCEEAQDYVSRDFLCEFLDSTEDCIDFLETQISLFEKIGIQNYLQQQIGN